MLKKPRMVIAITQEGNEIQTPTEEVTSKYFVPLFVLSIVH